MPTRVTITVRGVFEGRSGELMHTGSQYNTVRLDGEPYKRPDGTRTRDMAFKPSEYSPRAQRTT